MTRTRALLASNAWTSQVASRAIAAAAGALDMFDNVQRGDPHWLSIQFMKSQKVDRVAGGQLLESFEDAFIGWLDAFTMPTLVVCGSEDDDNGSAEELANVLPNAVFREVPGTHMSSVTKPEFGEAIAAFLAS